MKKLFRRLLPLPVLLLTLSLCGCWDHVEVSEMLIIAGIGLDVNEDGSLYRATVEIVNVEAEGGQNISAEIVQGEGDTIHKAVQDAMLMTGGVMFGNHCKVVVIGEELARRGIGPVVEMILRSPDYRKTVDILIARGSPAEPILKQKPVKNDIVSYELSKILRSNEKSIGDTVATGMYQLHEALTSDCAFFVVPAVYTRQNNGEDVQQVDGCAVFAEEKLLGFLGGPQVKLYHLLTNGARSITIPVEVPSLSPAPVDVRIAESRIRLFPALPGGAPSLRVQITAEVTLEEAVLPELDPGDLPLMELAQKEIGGRLALDAREMIAFVQSAYKADIFGFYREFEDRFRSEWPRLRQDWPALFAGMEVSVEVDVKVTGSGLMSGYLPKDGGKSGANALP